MPSINTKLDRARERVRQRQLRPALKLLRGILRDDPDHIETLDLLGQVSLKARRFGDAREVLNHAVKIWPRSARLHMNLGVAHHCLEEYQVAVERFKVALSCNRDAGMVYYHLGLSLSALGQLNDAGHSFQRALLRLPRFVPAHEQLAKTMVKAGKHHAAAKVYTRILELDPKRSDILVDLGNALRKCNNDEDAMQSFRMALQVNPKSVGALNNLSIALRERGECDESDRLIRRALRIAPKNPVLHNSYALVCERMSRTDEALASYADALSLRPNYRKAHYNLGGLLTELGRLDEAEASYERALGIEPDNAETRFRMATLKLLRGEFSEGFAGYEQRWEMEEAFGKQPAFDRPAWKGESLEGKTILVYAEQGFGDAMQFVRYVPMLAARGAKVLLRCHPRLKSLLSRVEGVDAVLPHAEPAKSERAKREHGDDNSKGNGQPTPEAPPLPEFDVHAAMLSLPGLFGETVDAISADVPYLHADPDRVARWGERLEGTSGLRVGICWQGKPTFVRDYLRSIPLAEFSPLAESPGVQLISLQQGFGRKQLEQFTQGERIIDLGPELDQGADGFEDTAAVIKNLDLVITSDTSLAHLAGGLGAPTWVALQHTPEWRWLMEREDSPWYPTARLFRQPAYGDWAGVFAEIREALSGYQPDRA